MDVTIRPVVAADRDALYDICLRTGDAGRDAAPLHADPHLMGDIYAVPYAVLLPDWSFVATDGEGVCGYVVGAPDTRAFEAELEKNWWPTLRRRSEDPGPPPHRTADAARWFHIHHPEPEPDSIVGRFPAHMHMNVLPRAQGRGVGRRLFNQWCEKAASRGVSGVFVGVSLRNAGGAAFWQACGMTPIAGIDVKAHPGNWFGLTL